MKSRHHALINLFLVLAIIVVLNAAGKYVYHTFDLTEDGRFTLTETTNDLLENLKSPIYAQVLLTGELPLEFQRLQTATMDMLERYKKLSGGLLEYEVIDPGEGSTEQINKKREDLSKEGIFPINIRVVDTDEKSEQIIYPYVLFRAGTRVLSVNVLENEAVAVSPDVQLNNSIGLLEYKYSNAVQKLSRLNQTNIAFLAGHGELDKLQTIDLENELRKFHNTGRLYLDSTYRIDPRLDLVIIPNPTRPFSEQHKFMIDQYLMKGGNIIWLVDKLDIGMDSLRQNQRYVPFDINLNLDDFFFRNGIRINSDLVQDLECTRVPLTANQNSGAQSRYELYKWYYHILAMPTAGHAITNNLDRVNLLFPSTIDTLKTKFNVKKTVLLTSSPYARFQLTPVQLDLNSVRVPIVPEKFNKPRLPVGVLLEGTFASLYENRVTEGMLQGLEELGETFHPKSKPAKMLVISDGDMIRNRLKASGKEFWPLGYNLFERRAFANKEFILNSIEYMIGNGDVLQSRTKEVKLRLLNSVKASSEKLKWQLINVLFPILALIIFGVVFQFIRRRKYS